MSWSTEDGRHEGYLACQVSDGRISYSSRNDQIQVGPVGIRDFDTLEEVPRSTVVAWLVVCTCGWTGSRWMRVTDPGQVDLAAQRAFEPDGWEPPEVEERAHQEWKAHVAPLLALEDLREAMHEHGLASYRLEQQVAAAREHGASWTQVGTAVGITRQSAHQRWSTLASVQEKQADGTTSSSPEPHPAAAPAGDRRLDIARSHTRAEIAVRSPGMALGMWAGRGDYTQLSQQARDRAGARALDGLNTAIDELSVVRDQLAATLTAESTADTQTGRS